MNRPTQHLLAPPLPAAAAPPVSLSPLSCCCIIPNVASILSLCTPPTYENAPLELLSRAGREDVSMGSGPPCGNSGRLPGLLTRAVGTAMPACRMQRPTACSAGMHRSRIIRWARTPAVPARRLETPARRRSTVSAARQVAPPPAPAAPAHLAPWAAAAGSTAYCRTRSRRPDPWRTAPAAAACGVGQEAGGRARWEAGGRGCTSMGTQPGRPNDIVRWPSRSNVGLQYVFLAGSLSRSQGSPATLHSPPRIVPKHGMPASLLFFLLRLLTATHRRASCPNTAGLQP